MDENQSQNGLDLGLFINDQYVTVKKIGQGGFGVVWQAYDFSLRNFIAIKELLSEYSEPKFVEMFYKEALIAKNIIHDNIVRVQHFWKGSNGSYYISMDFVRGIDLEDLVKRCNELNIKIPWELSVLICISMLKAIDYANRVARDSITGKPYGIVYRDISPGNVLISFDGNVKLSDFGIAKTAEEIEEGMQQKVVTGKFPYMSPEQIKGLPDIDHRSDIFSIGVVFYEMLTGQQLFTGEPSEVKNKVLSAKFDSAVLAGLGLPYEIGEIISKALEKDREIRYDRAIEMYRDLRRLLKGVETEDLAVELASFVTKAMHKEHENSENILNLVKTLDRQEIKNNGAIPRIVCSDFIVGDLSDSTQATGSSPDNAVQSAENSQQPVMAGVPLSVGLGSTPARPQPQRAVPPPPQSAEAKGKTVFEEVGDWLVNKFKELKGKLIKIAIAVVVALLLFLVLDVFVQITPFGKSVYARLYPPDVVITTVPSGATVGMKTKDGDIILQNASSQSPIALRKVQPQTYIVTALKEGFAPVQKVVRIEERSSRSKKSAHEPITLIFDFMLDVNSVPEGADVYVDGNKFGVTPCKIQLQAGEHTVRLALTGYEDLGSKAKESREGQCNIDFSKPNKEDMFGGVDKRYWETDMKNVNGENVFAISGHMFKQFKFTSVPQGMMVHIEGEGQPRGLTPLNANIKAGNYKVRMMDPEGRYGEALKQISVSAEAPSELYVLMNKLISFRVRAKNNPAESFISKVTIQGKEFNTSRNVGTGKPVIVPLPSGKYNFTFTADEFKPFVLKNMDIANITSVTADMEYAQVAFNLSVVYMDMDKEVPVENAYVHMYDKAEDKEKIVGKTDAKGLLVEKRDVGTIKGKINAKGYLSESFEVVVNPGKSFNHKVILVPEAPIEPLETIGDLPVISTPAAAARPSRIPATPDQTPKPAEKPKNEQENLTVIVCPNCGYINTVPAGRRLRFCVNCARPLR